MLTALLAADSTGQVPEACMTPDETTAFVFEAPLLAGVVLVSDVRAVSFSQVENFPDGPKAAH
ncbi:hypothetical protein ACN28S_25365 [Cystobacter fuscus]